MIHPLKIANTLADETRYSIYETIIQTKKTYTVQQIADQFNIHPNVARLHLTKLTEVGLIDATFEKTGRGGRPGRVYKFATKPISLTYPKQENTQLLNWTLRLVEKLGAQGLALSKEIAYENGFNEMKAILKSNFPKSIEQKISLLSLQSSLIGYIPSIEQSANNRTSIQFTIFNCPYQNQIEDHHNVVCSMHEAYLRGQMDALFGPNHFVQFRQMTQACDFCDYKITPIEAVQI